MKTICILFILICIVPKINGQAFCGAIGEIESENFEENSYPDISYYRDTASNPDNIWQVGIPQKATINLAFSEPRCIITDTTDSYPTNDTSSFIIQTVDYGGWSSMHSAELSGKYFVNDEESGNADVIFGMLILYIFLPISFIINHLLILYSDYIKKY